MKPNGKFCRGVKGIDRLECITCLLKSHLSCLAIYNYFVLNSAQSSGKKKNFGNMTMKNYLKESLLSLLCFIIHGQGSSENGFKILNYETEIYLIAVVSCLHGRN